MKVKTVVTTAGIMGRLFLAQNSLGRIKANLPPYIPTPTPSCTY